MKKFLTLLFASIFVLAPLCGCSEKDEPLEEDKISSVDVTYTLTLSEEMLTYFNITANYKNSSGQAVGKHMDGPTLSVSTSTDKIPANLPIWFTVTRTDVANPTTTPKWSEKMEISVVRHYSPSGKSEYSEHRLSNSYSPLPDKFNDWAEHFISIMEKPHQVSITATGAIEF